MWDSLMPASWNASRSSGSSHTDWGDSRLFFTISAVLPSCSLLWVLCCRRSKGLVYYATSNAVACYPRM